MPGVEDIPGVQDLRDGARPVGGSQALDRKADAKRRLAAALRANLRRRKAPPPDDPAVGPASPDRDGRAAGEGGAPLDAG